MAPCEGLGRSFSLTLLEVGAEDACVIASHRTFWWLGRVKVEDSEHMWDVVKACEGHKFQFHGKHLSHGIDKTPAHMDLSGKNNRSLLRLRMRLTERGLLREEASRDDFNRLVVTVWDTGSVRKRKPGFNYSLVGRVGSWIWLGQYLGMDHRAAG